MTDPLPSPIIEAIGFQRRVRRPFQGAAAALGVALFTAIAAWPVGAGGATLLVSTTTDEYGLVSPNGLCSLREAVSAMAAAEDAGGCANANAGEAYGVNDRIELGAAHYPLQIPGAGEDANLSGDIDVGAVAEARTLTIAGQGSASTIIDAQGIDRVFDVLASTTVRLEGLTVRNGLVTDFGGAIAVDGAAALTLERVVVADSSATDTSASGPFLGGGIFSEGPLTVIDSTIRDNFVGTSIGPAEGIGVGGGIAAGGPLRIEGSAITGNETARNAWGGAGGGLFVAVSTSGPDAVITNSTFSGNKAVQGGAVFAGGCFAAGTPVWTETGPRPIESIRVGDRVWAWSEPSGERAWAAVESVHPSVSSRLVRLELDSGVVVRATAAHPIWVAGRGWTPAGEIAAGDTLLDRHGGPLVVATVGEERARAAVYDLTVAGFHTYHVSDAGVLVHNK